MPGHFETRNTIDEMPQSFYSSSLSSGLPAGITPLHASGTHWHTPSPTTLSSFPASAPNMGYSHADATGLVFEGLPTLKHHQSQTILSPDGTSALSPSSLRPTRVSSDAVTGVAGQLTDDQADFVNNLHRSNVPAAAIVRIVESMLAGGSLGGRDGMVNGGADIAGPPSYDHHRR